MDWTDSSTDSLVKSKPSPNRNNTNNGSPNGSFGSLNVPFGRRPVAGVPFQFNTFASGISKSRSTSTDPLSSLGSNPPFPPKSQHQKIIPGSTLSVNQPNSLPINNYSISSQPKPPMRVYGQRFEQAPLHSDRTSPSFRESVAKAFSSNSKSSASTREAGNGTAKDSLSNLSDINSGPMLFVSMLIINSEAFICSKDGKLSKVQICEGSCIGLFAADSSDEQDPYHSRFTVAAQNVRNLSCGKFDKDEYAICFDTRATPAFANRKDTDGTARIIIVSSKENVLLILEKLHDQQRLRHSRHSSIDIDSSLLEMHREIIMRAKRVNPFAASAIDRAGRTDSAETSLRPENCLRKRTETPKPTPSSYAATPIRQQRQEISRYGKLPLISSISAAASTAAAVAASALTRVTRRSKPPQIINIDLTDHDEDDAAERADDAELRQAIRASEALAAAEQSQGSATKRTRKRKLQYSEDDKQVKLVYPIAHKAQDAITIFAGDLRRLEGEEFLNDSLIDLQIKLCIDALPPERRKKIHAFSSLFYTKLTQGKDPASAHALVCRWTRHVDLFSMDFVLIPINLHCHWSICIVVRPGLVPLNQNRPQSVDSDDEKEATSSTSAPFPREIDNKACLLCMDSIKRLHPAATIARNITSYLQFEWRAKSNKQLADAKSGKESIVFNKNSLPVINCTVPAQANSFDCGMFVGMFAKKFTHLWPSSTEEDISNKFQSSIHPNWFHQADIDAERNILLATISELKELWEKRPIANEDEELPEGDNIPSKTIQSSTNNERVVSKTSDVQEEKQASEPESEPESESESESESDDDDEEEEAEVEAEGEKEELVAGGPESDCVSDPGEDETDYWPPLTKRRMLYSHGSSVADSIITMEQYQKPIDEEYDSRCDIQSFDSSVGETAQKQEIGIDWTTEVPVVASPSLSKWRVEREIGNESPTDQLIYQVFDSGRRNSDDVYSTSAGFEPGPDSSVQVIELDLS